MRMTLVLAMTVVVLLGVAAAAPKLNGTFQLIPAETDESLYQIQMFEGGTAYACGGDGMVIRTADSGENWDWEQIREGLTLRVMHWLDTTRGFFAGKFRTEYRYYGTRDGAKTFYRVDLELPFTPRAFTFLGPGNGWVVCGDSDEKDGDWRVTKDGGKTWHRPVDMRYHIPGRVLYDITNVGGKHLYAVGGHVEARMVGEAQLSVLYQAKQGAVLHSGDGGTTWEVQDAGNPAGVYLRGVDFTDVKHGWVVGDKGFIATTRDGGKTWTKRTSGTEERLLAVNAVSMDVAFAVGYRGTAIATKNKGENWNPLDARTKVHLRDCSFLDEKTGYSCGKNGRVLRFARIY